MLIFHHKFVQLFESVQSIDCRPLPAICAWLVICTAAAPPAAIQA